MFTGLIGDTGFVGSNLLKHLPSDTLCFNSANSRFIAYQQFGVLYCAGISATKWKANQQPVPDLAAIQNLLLNLRLCKADRLVFISTIDVLDGDPANFYGANRRSAEDAVIAMVGKNFEAVTVVRLPALFGPGLKKNILFDLLHGDKARIAMINPESSYQWYPIRRLWQDIQKLCYYGYGIGELYPPTIKTDIIAKAFFPDARLGSTLTLGDPVIYKRPSSSYFRMLRREVLGEMAEWIAKERA